MLAGLRHLLLFALSLGCCILLWFSAPVRAATFPITESFTNTTHGAEWHLGEDAELTATKASNGWLRLTKAEETKKGYAFDNEGFPSTDGVLASFEYADYGGTGADGLTFFLYNSAVSSSEFRAGQAGGSLGYASCNSSPGLFDAYIGVGFDEYGNFTNLGTICGLDGTEAHPNYVSIRGSEAEKYKLLASAPTAPEALRGNESEARDVTVSVVPSEGKEYVSAYIKFPSGSYETVVAKKELPKPPASLKFGFVASTGGSTDYHEIRNVEVTKPTEVSTELTAPAGAKRSEPITWTAVVTNSGPNESLEETATTTADTPLTATSWTCSASGGATCASSSGSGLPHFTTDKMPVGSKLTYTITGTPETSDSYAELTFDSEPTGETAAVDPADGDRSAKVDLTPRFPKLPTFTLNASGHATATAVAGVEGGDVTSTYQWQLCEPGTSNCSDISGATGTTYTTTAADRGHALRFVQIATNAAGTTEEASTLYEPPSTKITEQPAKGTTSTSAKFAFDSPNAEATFECQIDGGAWTSCTSAKTYEKLALGEHTFSVRAVYGNLSEADPPSYKWLVEAAPAVSKNPANQTVNEGEDATFEAAASGTPEPTVQWEVSTDAGKTWANDTSDAGNSTDTLTIAHAKLAQSGYQYRAKFTNTAGSQTTTAASLTVHVAPAVSKNPANQTANEGEDATFEAAASGTPEPTVQWEVSTDAGKTWANDTSDAGNSTDTLTIAHAKLAQSGYQYRAKFTNTAGSQTTTAASLTVHVAPAVSKNPANQTANEGEDATFEAAASGTPEPTVQWEVSTDAGKTWANDTSDAGNSTDTLTIAHAKLAQSGYQYRAKFTNTAGSQTTTAASLTVHVAPAVSKNPANQTANEGEDATFEAAASGTPEPTVQWEVSTDAGKTWANDTSDAGNSTDTLTIAHAKLAQSGYQYRAKFTNTAGSQTTTAASLTVHVAPAVSKNPANQTVNEGEDATFEAAASGTPEPTVQWEVSTDAGKTWANDTSDAGNSTDTLTIAHAKLAQSGYQYRAKFTNTAGSQTTTAASLTVHVAPAVSKNPANQTVNEGEDATFEAAASGTPEPTVQWEVSTDAGKTWSDDLLDPGNSTDTLTVPVATLLESGYQYRAKFTNTAGSQTTTAATLTVQTPPVSTESPVDETVIEGESATFKAAGSGTPEPTVQWEVSTDAGKTWSEDTTDAGAGTDELTVAHVPASISGRLYRARFKNPAGSATSAPATLTVLTPPRVTANPAGESVLEDENATFSAAAEGNPTPSVQWEVSTDGGATWGPDTADPGNTTDTLTVNAPPLSDSGRLYRARFYSPAGSATSAPAPLLVSAPQTTAVSPAPGPQMTARLKTRATVQNNRRFTVSCKLDSGDLRSCSVKVYAHQGAHTVLVGTATNLVASASHPGLLVHISLNRTGRRLLGERLGGLGVTLLVRGTPFDYHELHARLHTRLYPQHLLLLPIIGPFDIAQSWMPHHARLLVDHVASQIRHAHRVTCIGSTDSEGASGYNLELGMRRARTVCAALRRLGVHAALSTRTLGKRRPRASNATWLGRELNRRVELEVSY